MKAQAHIRPTTLKAAYEAWKNDNSNALLGGGLWLKKLGAPVGTLIDLSDLGLNQIEVNDNEITIGAMTPLRAIETNETIRSLGQGILSQGIASIMGVALRNMATLGGSVAGKYPFSDIIAPLLVLDAELVFYPERSIALAAFLEEKGKTKDILTHIIIRRDEARGYFKKISHTPLDFAILNVAIARKDGHVSIAVGSRPAVAMIATKASEHISHINKPNDIDFEETAKLAVSELSFMTTNAASGEYRAALAKAYVKRGLKEVFSHDR